MTSIIAVNMKALYALQLEEDALDNLQYELDEMRLAKEGKIQELTKL